MGIADRNRDFNEECDSEESLIDSLKNRKLPVHVAIIMDGNGRWAKEHNLSRIEGHKAGSESVREAIKFCLDFGIKHLSLFAFSTENWRRPKLEVDALMSFLKETIEKEVEELCENGVRMNFIGRISELPKSVTKAVDFIVAKTQNNDKLVLTIAVNYSGRADIVDAAKKIVSDDRNKKIDGASIDEDVFSRYVYTCDIPDPDLLIRTSGELRISNFFLWQLAYSEIWITQIYWPDFRRIHFLKALVDYGKRERRFGALK